MKKKLTTILLVWSFNSLAQTLTEQQEFFNKNSWSILEANAERGYWYSPYLLMGDAKNILTFYYATTGKDGVTVSTLDRVTLDCGNNLWTPSPVGDKSRDSSQFPITKGTVYSNTQSKLCGFGDPVKIAYTSSYEDKQKHWINVYLDTKHTSPKESPNIRIAGNYLFDATDKKWLGKGLVAVNCNDMTLGIYTNDSDYKSAEMKNLPPLTNSLAGFGAVTWDRLCKPHGAYQLVINSPQIK